MRKDTMKLFEAIENNRRLNEARSHSTAVVGKDENGNDIINQDYERDLKFRDIPVGVPYSEDDISSVHARDVDNKLAFELASKINKEAYERWENIKQSDYYDLSEEEMDEADYEIAQEMQEYVNDVIKDIDGINELYIDVDSFDRDEGFRFSAYSNTDRKLANQLEILLNSVEITPYDRANHDRNNTQTRDGRNSLNSLKSHNDAFSYHSKRINELKSELSKVEKELARTKNFEKAKELRDRKAKIENNLAWCKARKQDYKNDVLSAVNAGHYTESVNSKFKNRKLNESVDTFDSLADKEITIYDVSKFIQTDLPGYDVYGFSGGAAILPNSQGQYCIVDFEAVGFIADSIESPIELDVRKADTFAIIPVGAIETTVKEIMETAPTKTQTVGEFFAKCKSHPRCQSNFSNLISKGFLSRF